jgi:hypothetical protein
VRSTAASVCLVIRMALTPARSKYIIFIFSYSADESRRIAAHQYRLVRLAYQPVVLFSQNKPATSNQPAVLFSQNKPAPAISHQPTEQAVYLI